MLTGLDDFLKKPQPETFDFRDLMPEYYEHYKVLKTHRDNPVYQKLLDELKEMEQRDPVEKFYLYRTLGVGDGYQDCGRPFDCDNSNGTCQLSDEIYEALWSREALSFCRRRREKTPAGDTMNSVATTLRALTGRNWLELCGTHPEGFQRAAEFIGTAYTIGNFIPWPVGCNGPRGIGPVHDYWDLTLHCIHQWYQGDADGLARLFGCRKPGFSAWLTVFGSWDAFIEANYLQDFTEWSTRPYGRPKEFWDGHFSGKVLPETDPEFNAFFAHAAEGIRARGLRMVAALRSLPDKKEG